MPTPPTFSEGFTPNPSQPPLADLAKQAFAGSSAAFEALFRRLGPAVRRMLLGRVGGNQHLADDLSQRTWAGVWKSLQTGSYDPSRSAITTYVYAVAYRTWLHDLRQSKSGIEGETVPTGLGDIDRPSLAAAPDAATDLADAIDTVRSALAGFDPDLSDDERDLLRALSSGESDRSIAKRLGLAASTVNVRKQTALSKLQRILARKGFRGESSERGSPERQ